MLIRPELQALRDDDAPQRRAQAAVRAAHEAWRSAGEGAVLEAELEAFAAGRGLDGLPVLGALFDPADAEFAQDLVSRSLAPMFSLLASAPFSQSPWRYSMDEVLTSIVLARSGTAALMVQVFDGAGLARRPAARAVSFLPAETWERVLAGQGDALQVRALSQRREHADLECTPIALRAGAVRHRRGTSEAQVMRAASGSLVLLKLQRRLGHGAVVREHLLADGRLVHQAAGSPRDSRLELTAALLGRMGRRDGAPLLAAMAEEEGAQSLRWQSLRECLALDTAVGFAALCRIAAHPDDPLAVPAGALRTRLLVNFPTLAGLSPCPA